jgi:hypothetical protein
MNELTASVTIETGRKRKPKSRSGKLLVAIRDKIISDLKGEVKERKFFVPTDKVEIIRRLNVRINRRLQKEDQAHSKQTQTELNFVTWKRKRKKVTHVAVPKHRSQL